MIIQLCRSPVKSFPIGTTGDVAPAVTEQGHRAPLLGGRIHALARHENTLQTIGAVTGVAIFQGFAPAAVFTNKILHRAADGNGDRICAVVFDFKAQTGYGQFAVLAVIGQQRIKAFDGDAHRQGGIGQMHLCKRICGRKGSVCKTGPAMIADPVDSGSALIAFDGYRPLKQAELFVAVLFHVKDKVGRA